MLTILKFIFVTSDSNSKIYTLFAVMCLLYLELLFKKQISTYTILYAPIRAVEDIYVLQSGKLCRIRSQYFGFKVQSPLFQGVGYILQEAIEKSSPFTAFYT